MKWTAAALLLLLFPQDPANPVDEHVASDAPACSDEEFLRRATLDLVGVVPTVEEARAGAKDRVALVDRLIASPEFDHWWARFLLELTTERRASRYDSHNGRALYEWLVARMKDRTPYDKIVRALLLAKGTANEEGETNFLLRYQVKPSDITGAVGRAFLGVRLQCAQCHDHPFDKYTQDDFWGAAAYFARTRRTYVDGDDGNMGVVDIKKGVMRMPGAKDEEEDEEAPVEERRKVVPPRWLNGKAAEKAVAMREQFAKLVTSPEESPTFARAIVNRVWARMMGRGIVEPLDGFGRRAKPSNPELLEALAARFVADGYDLRKLVRVIATSKAYGRSTKLAGVRPLTIDQLASSVVRATGYGLDEDGTGGEEPEQMEEGEDEGDYADLGPMEIWPSAPRTMRRSLAQLNGGYTHDLVEQGARFIMKQLGKPVSMKHVEHVYLALLSRRPAAAEAESLAAHLKESPFGRAALEDILWAVLNSVEFNSNH
jgi:hypothetical protein